MNSDQPLLPTRMARLLRRVPGSREATWGALVLLALYMPQAKADIWGYVDSERMPHFAASQLDERYELLLRDSNVVEPYRSANAAGRAQDSALQVPGLEAERPGLTATAGLKLVSPKLLAFFEHSANYKAFSPLLREASKTHGIDYSLLKALIATESGFNPYAVSPKGAVGLMQLIPPTAQRYGVTAGKNATIEKKLTDPKVNIKAGARYLADLIKMFPGRLELALAAYNAGEGAVQRAGNKIPNYPETQNYVKTVMQLYNGLAPLPSKAANGRVRLELQGTGRGATTPLIEPAPSLASAGYPQE
jgi:soluble lytic murein transglycosylase-like protein